MASVDTGGADRRDAGSRLASRAALVFAVFTLAYFLSQFFRHANAVIAGGISSELGLSAGALGLMSSLFYAAFAIFQFPVGAGLDRYGPRVVTSGVMLLAAAGSFVFAAAHSLPVLALGRALMGAGMAGVLMGSLVALARWFPPRRYATMAGLLVGLGALGGLAAASPLAWFFHAHGWRSVFVLGGVLVLVSASAVFLGGGGGVRERFSGVGRTSGEVAGAHGGLGGILRSPAFRRLAPLNFFMTGSLLAIQGLWAGPFLFDVAHLSTAQAARYLTLLSVGVALGYVGSGWLADRFGLGRSMTIGAAVFAAALVGFVVQAVHPSSAALWVLYGAFGVAGGFQILLLVHVRRIFAPSLTGRAVTALNFFGFAGAFALQWAMGGLVGLWERDPSGHYPPASYVAAFALPAAGMLVSILWYLPYAGRVRAGLREAAPLRES
jgi:MFS family permease